MASYRDVIVTERTEFDSRLNPKRLKVISFFVGKHGPFSIEVPAEEFDPPRVRQLLEAEAQRVIAASGV